MIPLEYTPLFPTNVKVGAEFGPIIFSVKPESHQRSKRLLEQSDLRQETRIETPYLFPSEMWGFARLFSSYFGRLNEAAAAGATWEIYGRSLPEQKLTVRSKVISNKVRNNLPFATTETITLDEDGHTLIRCLDEILLLHDVSSPFYQERAKETTLPENYSYDRIRKVYFRHTWNNGKWLNNIHTDEYARRFGYEKGLPEFIMYMDWVFLSQLEQNGERAYNHTIIKIEKILPIYKDELIRIFSKEEGAQHSTVQFFRGKQERLNALVLAGT